jgi:hypothetical protein
MILGTNKKTLTIVLCQTRESALTYRSLKKNVLRPLKSELAFCGSSDANSESSTDQILKNSRYVWNFQEPKDWAKACDAISVDKGAWRNLVNLSPTFLGGTGYSKSVGSGIIIMYWREILRKNISKEVLETYEWFVITRSDFFWKIKHPKVKYLNKRCIYLLDGERYGGISDRHIIFHRDLAKKVLSLAEPIFCDADNLVQELKLLNLDFLNPEIYLAFMIEKYNLSGHLKFLPYLGYTIRRPETKTRWSEGTYNEKLGLYVKYPEEYRLANEYFKKFRSQNKWRKYLAKG